MPTSPVPSAALRAATATIKGEAEMITAGTNDFFHLDVTASTSR